MSLELSGCSPIYKQALIKMAGRADVECQLAVFVCVHIYGDFSKCTFHLFVPVSEPS